MGQLTNINLKVAELNQDYSTIPRPSNSNLVTLSLSVRQPHESVIYFLKFRNLTANKKDDVIVTKRYGRNTQVAIPSGNELRKLCTWWMMNTSPPRLLSSISCMSIKSQGFAVVLEWGFHKITIASSLKGTVLRDQKYYLQVFDAKCVFFVWARMVFQFLYCLVIF